MINWLNKVFTTALKAFKILDSNMARKEMCAMAWALKEMVQIFPQTASVKGP
jgi:hypothetical protein